MSLEQVLNELSGIGIPDAHITEAMLEAESRILGKLIVDFNLTQKERKLIVLSLYRFKKTLTHFYQKWQEGQEQLSEDQQRDAHCILLQAGININRNSRSCFSASNFFGKIRFLLEPCKKLGIPKKNQEKYLVHVLRFPITPLREIGDLFTHQLYPSNLPHVYMDMAAGMIRGQLVMRTKHTEILRKFRTFQWERNKPFAHNRWFKSRLAGSVFTKQ